MANCVLPAMFEEKACTGRWWGLAASFTGLTVNEICELMVRVPSKGEWFDIPGKRNPVKPEVARATR